MILLTVSALHAAASAAAIVAVVRANGQSGERTPVGVFDGHTAPLPWPEGGLRDGTGTGTPYVYSDREFWWVNTPGPLFGSEYVRTFNSDKVTDELDVTYTVTLSRPATVWIAIDLRAITSSSWGASCPWSGAPGSLQPVADWVTGAFAPAGTFMDTGLSLGIRESSSTLRTAGVFSAALAAGTYVFGAMPNNSIPMYTIGVMPEAFSQHVTLSADGPGNTYELISSVLGGNPLEVPDCGHPEFGRHITEEWDDALGKYVFVFHMHVTPDNDRCTNFDRQRNEIKTYGPSPSYLKGRYGEVHTYRWKFKLDAAFKPSPNFTHIFQIKAGDGSDSGSPLITLTPRHETPQKMQLIFTPSSGTSGGGTKANPPLEPFKGEWVEAYVRTLYSETGTIDVVLTRIRDGAVLMSYSNHNLDMWRGDATFNRPKWGLYRSLNSPDYLADEQVRFADFCIAKGGDMCPSDVPDYSPTGLAAEPDTSRVFLSWIPDAQAVSYAVKRSMTEGGPYATIATGITAANFTDTETVNGTTYYYVVSSIGPSGEIGISNEVRARPQVTFTFEAESLARSSSGASTSPQTDSQTSGGVWIALQATGTGQFVDFTLPNIPAGDYWLSMRYKGHSDRGILRASVNGVPVGGLLDQYDYPSSYPEHPFGIVTFSSPGNQVVRLSVAGKHPASGGYTLSADAFKLVYQPVPGDLDGNGAVDYRDFAVMSAQWLTDGVFEPSADVVPVGGDGEVGLADLAVLCEEWLSGQSVSSIP